MSFRLKLFLIFFILCAMVGTVFFFALRDVPIRYEAKQKEAEPLDPNVYHVPAAPYPRGLSFIFLSDGYLSWNDFDKDIDALLSSLRQVEPWRSSERYNVYKILARETDLCTVKTADERKPVLRCDPEKLNVYLNRLSTGPFKLIVLSKRDFQSWANVKRLEDSGIFFSVPTMPQDVASLAAYKVMFLHLLGHAFGLKDEEEHPIAKADSAALVPDGPNCAPDKATAEKWWGRFVVQKSDSVVGYFNGCAGNTNYIKPTKISLMNLAEFSTAAADYGPVSEEYLRKILTYCFQEKTHRVSDDPEFFAQYPEFRTCAAE